MISYDNENIPPKEDTAAVNDEIAATTNPTATSNGDIATPVTTTQTVETSSDGVQTTSSTCTTTSATTGTNTNRRFNIQFQQKTKYIREMWSQQRVRINKDYSQFIFIIFICALAIIASVASLTTNNWSCEPTQNRYFGLWNTCQPGKIPAPANSTIINGNSTETSVIMRQGIVCAKQGLYDVLIEFAEQSRIDQITASQALIIGGIFLYIIGVFCFILGYKFLKTNNMNYLRNALITSIFVQIIAFLLLLFGFFLFIFTDRFSISIVLLFVYFALAIFATNIINFITIEYKSYKIRQIPI